MASSLTEQILKIKQENPNATFRQIANILGKSREAIRSSWRRHLGRQNKTGDKNTVSEEKVVRESFTINGDNAVFEGVTDNFIRSEEDALREFKIDTSVWCVESMVIKAWTVGMKVGNATSGYNPSRQQQWAISLKLKRKLSKSQKNFFDEMFRTMEKYAPKYPKINYVKRENPVLAVVCIFDSHFGKLCWAPETGENYDLKIARKVHSNAVDDLMMKFRDRPVERIVFIVGNDGTHMDNPHNTTFRGTKQDVDGRYERVMHEWQMANVEAIEKMMGMFPVDAVRVDGNHDPTTSFHTSQFLKAWFRNASGFTIDESPKPRKYYNWNRVLLGFTHGDSEKKASLPSIMSNEAIEHWSKSTCHEWICGHDHRSRQWQTQGTETCEGVVIRTIRSPAATDAWHKKSGYIGSKNSRATEVYFYTEGAYDGHEVALVRVD